MNPCPLSDRQAKRISLTRVVCALAVMSWMSAAAQGYGPKNGMLLVFGYEMDKARANAIVQTQDMTQDIQTLVGKLETLTQAKGAAHSACAAQTLRSGMRSALEMGYARLTIEPIIGNSGETVVLAMQRTDKASGTESTVKATLKPGDYAFIGTVPDVKPGRDVLLFVRCLMQYLE